MRGKLDAYGVYRVLSGITPADAGKTKAQYQKEDIVWDHPRGCGENILIVSLKRLTVGSPPRMRGKRVSGAGVGVSFRITPADAGKTILSVDVAATM